MNAKRVRPLLMILMPLPIAAVMAQQPAYPRYEEVLPFVDGHKLTLKDGGSTEPLPRFAGISRIPGLVRLRESFVAEILDDDDQI